MGVSEAEALQYIQENFDVTFLPKKLQAQLEAQRINQRTKNAIYNYTHYAMCNAVGNPAAHSYSVDALDWLVNARKIPQNQLHTLPIGIMPPLLELVDGMSKQHQANYKVWRKASQSQNAKGPPGRPPEDFSNEASTYLGPYFKTAEYQGAVVFPLHANPNEIARLKLRKVPKPGEDKKFIIPEDEFEEYLGIFGLGWYMYETFLDLKGEQLKQTPFYLVEGEMDALTPMAQFAVTGNVLYPILSVGGSGGAKHIQPILSTLGISKTYMIGDAPSAAGNAIVKEWLKKAPELHSRVFTGWDKLIPAKDIDEAINDPNIGFNTVNDVIWKNIDDHFTSPWRWAYNLATPELDSIPDHDRRSLIEKAAEYGKFLIQPHDREFYIKEISQTYEHISFKLLKRELNKTEDNNELGFVDKCVDALRDMFFVVGTRTKTNGRYLILQHKKGKTYHEVRINSGDSVIQELAPLVGGIYQFIAEEIGIPPFMPDPKETDGQVLQTLDKQLTFFMKESINSLCQGAPDYRAASRRKQGYHYIERENKADLEYIVCGKDTFRILRDSEDTPPRYLHLEGPADKHLIFDINFEGSPPASWYPGGLTEDMLNEGAKVDIKNLYEDLVRYYDCAFKFKNQNTSSELMAALVMSFPIMDAFERPVLVFITGDTNSGKSTLTATIVGSSKFNKLAKCRLLYSSTEAHDYSPSGIARTADLSSCVVGLDEFEVGGEGQRGKYARATLDMMRSMVNGEVKRIRAAAGGGSGTDKYTLRMPMVFNSITGADKPEDINRMLIVEMEKMDSYDAPATILERTFGLPKIKEMSLQLNTAMYAHAMTLRKHYYEISNQYQKLIDALPQSVDQRYLSSLYGPMAVMRMIGKDWKQFLVNFVTRNETMITIANTASAADSYLTRILNYPVAHNYDTHQNEPIGMLLANPDRWDEINRAVCGVFFDKSQQLLLLILDTVVTKYFPGDRNMTAMRLQEALQRHKLAIRPQELGKYGIVDKAAAYFGAGVRYNGVVVLRAKELIEITFNAANMYSALQDTEEESKENENAQDESTNTGKIVW